MPGKKVKPLKTAKRTVTSYVIRAKKHLPKNKKDMIALAREEMRILFGRD